MNFLLYNISDELMKKIKIDAIEKNKKYSDVIVEILNKKYGVKNEKNINTKG